MAGYNNYTYNRGLESLRNKVDQKIYQRRMQIIEEKRRAKSVRSMFDIFFNAEARERAGGDNWFETTLNATGEWFNHNFVEWFRNPVSGLLNNLSAIGSDLDYAANLIKAPLIAAAKGEDVGERLADAYGLGDKGRIDQNMSELREVLGANSPGGEIATTTGFGALSGAEMGSKGGPLGALIGAVVGAGVGLVGSSVDIGVRESGTTNSFLKGTQTVCNTLSDMLMEYGADPANFFGGIGNIKEFNKTKELTKGFSNNTVTDLASKEPACLDAFRKSAKGERAFRSNEILAVEYHRAAQLAKQPITKNGKEIIRTAEEQRKFVERRIKNVMHSYMNGDKKAFNKNIIETGIGKYLSDDEKVLTQQIDSIYKVLRQEANMSKVGRFAAFINNFDADFAKTLYKGTVPGLTLTMATKAVMKGYKVWENALLETVKKFENGDIVTPTIPTGSLVQKAAVQHYYKFFDKFDGLKGKYNITDDMTPEQVRDAYKAMSEHIILFNQRKYNREARVLQSLRRNVVLKNDTYEIRLGDADYAIRALSKNKLGAIKLTDKEIEQYTDTISKLFYFEEGIDFFQSVIYDPSYFKGDFKVMTDTIEPLVNNAINTVKNDPNYKYTELLNKIANSTFKWDDYNTDVIKFYNTKLHEAIVTVLESNRYKDASVEEQQQFIKDIETLLNQRNLDDETIKRINDYLLDDSKDNPLRYILNSYSYKDVDNITLADIVELYDTDYRDILKHYQDIYKDAREGARIRMRFQAYSDAIDNSKEITEHAKIKMSEIQDLRQKDADELDEISKVYTKRLLEQAAKEMTKEGTISENTINKIVESFGNSLLKIKNDIDDYSSYDVASMMSTQLGAGSTKLYNVIKRSRIKKPRDVEGITDEQWFLNEFKRRQQLARDIYSNAKFKPKEVKGVINQLHNYMIANQGFREALNKAKLEIDKSQYRSVSSSIIKYIFSLDDAIDGRIVSLGLGKHPKLNGVEIHNFLEGLATLRNIVNDNVQWLYTSLTKSFGTDFINGQDIFGNVTKVFDVLDFAVKDDNLFNGDFVDNLLQQTVFEDTVTALSETFYTNPEVKKLFDNILEQINVDPNTRNTISDAFNGLYQKRRELITRLIELDDPATVKKQLNEYLFNKQFKKYEELSAAYNYYNDLYNAKLKEYKPVRYEDYGFDGDKIEKINQREMHKQQIDSTIKDYPHIWSKELGYNKADVDEYLKARAADYKQQDELIKIQAERDNALQRYYNYFSQEAIAKRNKTAESITPEQVQLMYINQFKKETDELYNKLNSLTRSMLINDADPNKLIDKSNKDVNEMIKQIFTFEWSKKDKDAVIKGLLIKLNDIVLGDYRDTKTDFVYVKDFINLFKKQRKFKNISIKNGKFVFEFETLGVNAKPFARGNISPYTTDSFEIDANSFGKFFNNIVGMEQAYWLRNNIIKESGLHGMDNTIKITPLNSKKMLAMHQKISSFYNSYFNNILTNTDYTFSNKEIKEFLDIINSYDNTLNDIKRKLTAGIDFAEENSPTRVKPQVIKSGVLLENGTVKSTQSFFHDNTKNDNFQRQIKYGRYALFDEPYVSTVTLKKGNPVREAVTMQDLKSGKYDDELNKAFNNAVMSDIETDVAPGIDANDNSQKSMLQLTIRTKNGYRNIMVRNNKLDNDYKYGNSELLDAEYVNGNYEKVGGKLINSNNDRVLYQITDKDSKTTTQYELYHTPKKAAIALEEAYKSMGAIDENGTLYIVGHNASKFDADILLRFIKKNNPNSSIKSIRVYDTLWLSRAVMAAEYVDKPSAWKFIDDESATLGNLYKHWIDNPDELLANAHNANADTEMNRIILEHIKNKVGDKPSDFFKKYFTEDITIDKNTNNKISTGLNNIKNIKYRDAYDAAQAKLIKDKELRQTINDEYIKKQHKQLLKGADELINEYKNIKTIQDLEKFKDNLDDFYTTYDLYLGDSNTNSIVFNYYSNQNDLFEKKLSMLHGNSRVQLFANRERNDAALLDGFSAVMSSDEPNALNDVLFILNNAGNSKLLNKYDKTNLTTIGSTVKGLLEQYNYDTTKLFNDYPLLKQFYGYTNRINAFTKFRNEMYTMFYDVTKNASPEDCDKYTVAFSGIISDLLGFGKDKNISLDGYLQDLINGCSLEEKNNTAWLKGYLKPFVTEYLSKMFDIDNYNSYMKVFGEDAKIKIKDAIQNYVDNCLDNLEEYSLGNSKRGFNAMTILRPTPDNKYINLVMAALGSNDPRGILGRYQSDINPIIEETAKKAGKAQKADQEDGLLNITSAFRDNLTDIDIIKAELKYSRLPRAYIEQLNNKTITQINGLMNNYSVKSVDNYTKEMNEIIDDRNYIYNAFDINYDKLKAKPTEFRNVQTKFYKVTEDIASIFKLNSYQMEDLADIAALKGDASLTIKKQLFAEYFDELVFNDEEQELYERFKQLIINYKLNEVYGKPDEFKELEQSIKAYFAAAKLEQISDLGASVNANTYKPLTKMENMINHTVRYAQESNRLLNELFTDETGNINYALMAKYIKSNPYMKVVAMVPSDRFNNVDKQTKQAQIASEFITTDFDSVDALKTMMTHKPDTDGIRYFVVDNHNLMMLKKMIGQSTSNKTYTDRAIFKNHPYIQKMMHFRDFLAKYMLLPTKVLGLQNLGFTVTNTIEGFLKTMVATEGNKLKTVRKYKDAIQYHRNWSRATGMIANAIKGSPFCLEKNQWTGMLKELENSKALFGEDLNLLKTLVKNNDIDGIKKLMPSPAEFKELLLKEDVVKLTNYDKRILYNKYNKLFTKSEDEQSQAIISMLERYINTSDTYSIVSKEFNKEQFDFVTDFVNSPAAAAEMQSIKKANELNLIGNKQRYNSNNELVKEDPISRFYKKALFSDWGFGEHNPLRVITPYYNLSLNSDIETINRLALHMDLLDKGYTHSESYNRVLQTFFNYGNKSEAELMAELFFPFISFPFRTTLFWDEMLDEHPQMIKVFADLVLTNWGKDAQNQYNQTGITKGGLKITPNLSMESGSSFLDSLVFSGNALNVLANRKLNPLLGPLVEGAKQLTIGGDSNWDYRLSRLPIVSKVMYSKELVDNLSKGNHALYDIAPSVFHKVYEDNRYYYNNQQRYNYRSIYSRLYTATGYNRWNSRTTKGRVNAVKYLQGTK